MNQKIRTDIDLNYLDPQFSAGHTALKWASGHLHTSQDAGWLYGSLHERLFLAAMHELKVSGPAHIVFALPYGWADAVTEKFVAHYRRDWRILSTSRQCSFYAQPAVKKQGSLALLANAYNFVTQKPDMEKLKHAVVIDIGALTTDYLRVVEGRGGNACGSVPDLGIKSVYNAFVRWMHGRKIILTDTEAMAAVESREFYHGGVVSGVAEKVDDLLSKLAQDVYYRVRNDIKDLDTRYPYILITGGAGALIFPYLQPYMPTATLAPNALIDNAVGAVIAASRLSGSFDAAIGIDVGLGNVKAVRVIGETIHGVVFPSVVGEGVERSDI